MLFGSYTFVFLFLPLTVVGYFMLAPRHIIASRVFLLAASLFFYGYFNPVYLLLLLGSLFGNYAVSCFMCKFFQARRFWLFAGIVANLLLLGFFKYHDFFVSNVNPLFQLDLPLRHVLLPLGISFFTFQQISYLSDIANERLKEHYSFLTYALFITFFPQLVAGPIVLADEMMPQFDDKNNFRPNFENISCGIFLFALGLAKKMLLADLFAPIADEGFCMADPGMLDVWRGALAYMFQIYFDFSGYCDMAIGIGMMFNIMLPVNFNSPYRSAGIQDFWRRWHITLGRFLALFVYRPLGGSRKGEWMTAVNLLVTFFVSGLWHGASWLFVLWGMIHGVGMVTNRIWSRFSPVRLPHFLAVALTFLFVCFSWILFRADNLASAGRLYRGLLIWRAEDAERFFKGVSLNNLFLFIVAFAICFLFPPANAFRNYFKPTLFTLAVSLVLLIGCVFSMNRISPFIYFNF